MGEQIKIGTKSEKNLAKLLRNFQFWVYNIPVKTSGQPCDIIAIKKNLAFLIDSKHVRKEEISFPFKRIEPNQIAAMSYAHEFAEIENIGFAIYFERKERWYWLPFSKFIEMQNDGQKSVNETLLEYLEDILNENDN